ncbi:hypothetical protein HRG_012907 [Hirsutella rhossiliensis]
MSLMNSLPTTYGKNLTMAPTITLDNGEVYRTDQTIVQQKSLQPVTLSTLLYNEKTLSTHSIGSIALKTPVGRITFHILQTPTQEEEEPPDRHETPAPHKRGRPPGSKNKPQPAAHGASRTGRHTRANNNMCLQAKDLDDHKYNAPALRSSISATFKVYTIKQFLSPTSLPNLLRLFTSLTPIHSFPLFSLWPHFLGLLTFCQSTISSQAKDLDDHKYNAPALRSSISATFKSSKSSSTVHLFDPNTLFSPLFIMAPLFGPLVSPSLSLLVTAIATTKKIIHCTHLDS